MYICHIDNHGEENFHGPYEHVSVDGRTDDTIILLCDNEERIEVPYNFEMLDNDYLTR